MASYSKKTWFGSIIDRCLPADVYDENSVVKAAVLIAIGIGLICFGVLMGIGLTTITGIPGIVMGGLIGGLGLNFIFYGGCVGLNVKRKRQFVVKRDCPVDSKRDVEESYANMLRVFLRKGLNEVSGAINKVIPKFWKRAKMNSEEEIIDLYPHEGFLKRETKKNV